MRKPLINPSGFLDVSQRHISGHSWRYTQNNRNVASFFRPSTVYTDFWIRSSQLLTCFYFKKGQLSLFLSVSEVLNLGTSFLIKYLGEILRGPIECYPTSGKHPFFLVARLLHTIIVKEGAVHETTNCCSLLHECSYLQRKCLGNFGLSTRNETPAWMPSHCQICTSSKPYIQKIGTPLGSTGHFHFHLWTESNAPCDLTSVVLLLDRQLITLKWRISNLLQRKRQPCSL